MATVKTAQMVLQQHSPARCLSSCWPPVPVDA